MKNAVANLSSQSANKNFTRKKGSQTNPKDAWNAEETAKKVNDKCMMQFAQNVEHKQVFRLNRLKAEKFSAKIVLKKTKTVL